MAKESYFPIEGVDYIIDLYAVAGVSNDVASEEIKSTLNQRALEYHPDRLEGLAPEFKKRGELMARLLNRARSILLNVDSRMEYDEILQQWSGPVSTDGHPVMTLDSYFRADMAMKTLGQVEDYFADYRARLEATTSFSPSRLDFVEHMIEQFGDNAPDDLRSEYESALLEQDRVLAIEEAERARLLGVDIEKRRFEASFEYGDKVAGELEQARETRQEELQALSMGRFGARLALLAGEGDPIVSSDLPLSVLNPTLPAYFDPQAIKVHEIAQKREDILLKRLTNLEPNYPEAELQQEPKPAFIVGIVTEKTTWMAMRYDREAHNAASIELDEETLGLLNEDNIAAVIERGFNVFTFSPVSQIDLYTLLEATTAKYLTKYGLSAG